MKVQIAAVGLYVLGIMLAISGAAKVPAAGHAWPDTLGLFALGVSLCCVGLVGWRACRRSAKAGVAQDRQTAEALFGYLRDCRREATRLDREWSGLDSLSLRGRIDDLLVNHITPLVENRFVLIDQYGMRRGSEIILTLAQVERTFNRAWSATADFYPAEARDSFRNGLAVLEELTTSLDTEDAM